MIKIIEQGGWMNKLLLVFAGFLLVSDLAFAEPVRNWHALEQVHKHIQKAIREMERASAANNYDMKGHAGKAEQLLRDADRELHEAIESAKHTP
jgi:hypothetical protein